MQVKRGAAARAHPSRRRLEQKRPKQPLSSPSAQKLSPAAGQPALPDSGPPLPTCLESAALLSDASAEGRSPKGSTTRRFSLKTPEEEGLVLPRDLSAEVKAAARYLWQAYPDDTSRELLGWALESTSFDMNIDLVPDEQRLGRLMGAIPLDETELEHPLEPLQVAMVGVKTGARHEVEDPLTLIRSAVAAEPQFDVLLAPEWLFVPAGRFFSAAEFEDLQQRLGVLSKGHSGLLVPGTVAWVDDDGGYHNTALAFCDGELLKRYDKRNDGDDKAFAEQHGAHYARGASSSVFEWRGRQVGLEVCRDHGDARLRWDLERTGHTTVDLQLVVSAGVDFKHTAVGLGGVCLAANGNPMGAENAAQVGRRVARRPDDFRAYSPVTAEAPEREQALGQRAVLRSFTV